MQRSLRLTLMSMNFCIDSTHSSSITLDWKAPHRYLWPVYGLRTAGKTKHVIGHILLHLFFTAFCLMFKLVCVS